MSSLQQISEASTVKVGPFVWYAEDAREETWVLAMPSLGKRYAIKNYGGPPLAGRPFSGWRLVSSGAPGYGAWRSREEAMRGAIPHLVGVVRTTCAEAERALAELMYETSEARTWRIVEGG